MRFYDTGLRKKIEYLPGHNDIHIYVCGITPYDSAHLGHIFTFLTFDLLQRRLEDLGHSVALVRNITDIDEPIFKKAHENNEPYTVLASREIKEFQDVMKTLNFREPNAEPLASEYVNEMAIAVKKLLESGHAYQLNRDIYFNISTFKNFGAFSGFSKQLQIAFMSERGGDPGRKGKSQPLDFLLWRGIVDKNDLAAWDSPVGYGRPGWHIECSIMSASLLHTPLDIHGGGMDLIYPHHECEIAQSESLDATKIFSRHWIHVAPLLYEGEKMSKSLGNLIFAGDLLNNGSPAAIRLALFNYHYRIGGEWCDDLWQAAKELVNEISQLFADRSKTKFKQSDLVNIVRGALDDNLNTPAILNAINSHVKSKNDPTELKQALDLLGINI